MPGLLDFLNTPEGQGLLSAGFGGLAGARKGAPLNSIGRAGLAGLGGYTDAQDRNILLAGKNTQQQLSALQLEKAQRDNTNEKGLLGLQTKYTSGGLLGSPDTAEVNDALPPEMQIGALPAVAAQPQRFDVKGYTSDAMRQGLMTPIQAAQLQSTMAKDSTVNKLDVKDFSPASVQKYSQTGDYGDLVRMDKLHFADTGGAISGLDPFTGRPVAASPKTGDPYKDLVLSNGQGGFTPNSPLVGVKRDLATAGAAHTSNTVSIAGPENKYNAVVGEGLGKDGLALLDAAKAAPATISNAQMIRGALDKGAITGTGAGTRLAVQKALETSGLVGAGKAASTEELMAGLSKLTMGGIKTSGLGAGQGFTDKDREFLSSAISGTIEGTPANLRRVADLSEQVARATHQKGSEVLGRWQKDPALRAVAQDTVLDQIPATAVPALAGKTANTPAAPVPMKGMVRNGFKFKGGDPSSQANWEKQ